MCLDIYVVACSVAIEKDDCFYVSPVCFALDVSSMRVRAKWYGATPRVRSFRVGLGVVT